MKIADINPHIRFAEQITCETEKNTVYVKDCRLFYTIDGMAEIILDEQSVVLKKNSLFYCCGDKTYTIKTVKKLNLLVLNFDLSQKSSNLVMPFTPEEVNVVKNKTPIDKCHVQDSDFLNSFILIENCPEFKTTISDIIKEYTTQKTLFRESCNSILKKLLIEMHRKELEVTNNSLDAVNRVLDYIVSNYNKETKNSELASIAGYHEYYLNRLFIKHTGTSMHKYILNMRINEAKRLLLNTDMPLSQIAFATGFNSNTHFSNYFKKETEFTPFEYRNSFKNKI